MFTHYFGLTKKNEIIQTYAVKGIVKKAAENRLLFKILAPMKSLGEFNYKPITKSEHIEYQHNIVYDKIKAQKIDAHVEKLGQVLEKSNQVNSKRLEEYLLTRDIELLSEELMKGILQVIKGITLNELHSQPHYRYLQFIFTDMYNDIERLKVVVPEQADQTKVIANIIKELHLILLVALDNQTEFDCYDLFILFSTFESYYEYLD